MDKNVVLVLSTLAVGGALPFISEWLNAKYKANGKKAFAIAGGLSGILAALVLFLTGGLTVEDFTLANFTETFTAVFTVGQIIFQVIKSQLKWDQIVYAEPETKFRLD